MRSLAIFVPFVFLGVLMPPCASHEIINDGNFVPVLQRKANEMKKLSWVSREEQNTVNEELSRVVMGADLTDMEVVRKLITEKDRLSAELEGKVFATCKDETLKVLDDLVKERDYAWQMRAAYGKREKFLNSLYTWNTQLMGEYDICRTVQRDNFYAPIETLYCTEYFYYATVTFSRGVCVPASCSNQDLFLVRNAILDILGIGQHVFTLYTCIREIPWTWDAIFVSCLLGFFSVIVLIGTFYDIAFRRRRLMTVNDKPTIDETPKENGIEKGKDNYGLELQEGSKNDDSSSITDESTGSQFNASSFMTSEEEDENEEENAKVVTSTRSLIPGCKGKISELLTSWSLVYNSNKILSSKQNSSSLSCLNGIRVLSMLWIIWGHSHQFILYYVTDNVRYMYEDVFYSYGYNLLLFATFSVDTFFVLSGVLVTYLTLKELKERNGKFGILNWFLYYFHRIWRLTPTYMIALGIWASLVIHMGYGPEKEEHALYDKSICTDYWWTNLIYINNLYPFPGTLGGCMGWSWYLANDMQFYIICPLFILLLFHRKTTKLGLGVVVATCASSCIVTGALTAYYGLPVGKSDVYYNDRMKKFEEGTSADVVYGKPYCRIQSYMVGVFIGYFLYRHMHIKKMKIHWIVNIVGWIIGVSLMYSMVFSLHFTSSEHPLPQWFSAVWGGLSRTAFSIGVAWVIFACSTGNGGLINSFLSWSFWTPMARLTFGAYLLHPVVITLFLQAKMVPFHWSDIEMTYFFLANSVMSYFAAFCLSLLVEGPTMGLEKVFLRRKK